jgi:hypothetical protein
MLHLQHLVGAVLDVMGDGVPVRGTDDERAQDQHVESPLQHVAAAWL